MLLVSRTGYKQQVKDEKLCFEQKKKKNTGACEIFEVTPGLDQRCVRVEVPS